MKKLVEWCFEFSVEARETIDRVYIDLLLDTATAWAEAREFGIGGGYDKISNGKVEFWNFRFGLTATKKQQLISEKDASALLAVIKQFCNERGYELVGGFREYTEKELE